MKLLPYFRWYPADAESDAKYSAMSLAELGLFHRCLNHSWLNDGLSGSLNEMARELRIPIKELKVLWPRVSKCFVLYTGENRFRNSRQEYERESAISKSSKASEAANAMHSGRAKVVRTHSERIASASANAVPRAYGSVSESEYSDESKKSKDVDFEERFSVAWERHHKKRGGRETMNLVAQRLLSVDWDSWDKRHIPFCEYWDRHEWPVCTLSMLEWWENGMPLPPPEKQQINGREVPAWMREE